MSFILTTDTSCDEFKSELDKNNIPWLPLTFMIDGEVFEDDFRADEKYEEFFKKLEGGAMPTTSQITPMAYEEFFDEVFKNNAGDTIIHLSLSGGLSGTASNAKKAADDYMVKHPDKKIFAVDTLLATQAHNFLMQEVIKMRDRGIDAQQEIEKIEK